MRRSKLFLPTIKENPSEASINSHRLMLRAGMIRQSSSGIYTWLPLGYKVLRNIEKIIKFYAILNNYFTKTLFKVDKNKKQLNKLYQSLIQKYKR